MKTVAEVCVTIVCCPLKWGGSCLVRAILIEQHKDVMNLEMSLIWLRKDVVQISECYYVWKSNSKCMGTG